MAAPNGQSDSEIEVEGELVSKPFVEMTLRVMDEFGVTVAWSDDRRFRIAATNIGPNRFHQARTVS